MSFSDRRRRWRRSKQAADDNGRRYIKVPLNHLEGFSQTAQD